ncbi:hypothetical protein CHUAL_004031 [Chamberlinius hualienensis]
MESVQRRIFLALIFTCACVYSAFYTADRMCAPTYKSESPCIDNDVTAGLTTGDDQQITDSYLSVLRYRRSKEHPQKAVEVSGRQLSIDTNLIEPVEQMIVHSKKLSSSKRRLPQALIIGVKKCGTRALLEFIRLHPDVRAVGPETHFFDRHYHRGLEWYRRQMPPTLEGQLTMEKTPSYFVTKEVPRRVYNMSKDIKLLVVVRDPVTRAISDYAQTVSKRHHMKTFDELAYINNVTGLVDTSWGAIRIGVYAKYLERWLRYFSRHQLHFVSGEGLIRDPAGEMAKVQDFLGIRRIITENHFYFNETKGFPCVKKSERNGSPKCLGRTKGRTHPNVDNSTIRHLRDFYRPFNRKFYQMTGVDFGWP